MVDVSVQCTNYHLSHQRPTNPNRWVQQADDDLLMRALCAQQSASPVRLLTPTTTVSSPWNLGRNWSPRTISDWLSGRKRHSTFMLHSAGTSAIAQIGWGERKDALLSARCCCWWGCCWRQIGGPRCDRQNKGRGARRDFDLLRRACEGFILRLMVAAVYLCAAGWCFRVAVRRADRIRCQSAKTMLYLHH